MNSCEFATIEEAFGLKSLKSPEPPSLRGHIAEIHDTRAKAMDNTIKESHKAAQGYPGSPSCFGHANAGAERELERCPAGMSYCSACARRHECPKHHRSFRSVKVLWKSLSKDEKIDMAWLALRNLLTSDIVLFAALLVIVYLLILRS